MVHVPPFFLNLCRNCRGDWHIGGYWSIVFLSFYQRPLVDDRMRYPDLAKPGDAPDLAAVLQESVNREVFKTDRELPRYPISIGECRFLFLDRSHYMRPGGFEPATFPVSGDCSAN